MFFVGVLTPGGEDVNVETLLIDPFGFGPFARGLALGLAVAAPVGPMSLLCMRQTLERIKAVAESEAETV